MEVAFNKDIACFYEDWYKSPKGRLVDLLEKDLIERLCQIKTGDKVLEIGCGTGHFSSYFEELGGKVVGLDTSFEMLTVARDKAGNTKVDFKTGNAYALPFADREFDLVAMITTLEFIAEPKKALEEAFRVSKGKIFLGILNRHSFLAWQRKRSGKRIWQQANFYTLGEVKSLFGKDKKIKWSSALFLPLFNTSLFFRLRLNLERFLSKFNLPGGAFIGILAEENKRG